jgi:hypothetical protein
MLYVYALVAQLDRAVVSGTTSAGGSNPSERVIEVNNSKGLRYSQLLLFFVLKRIANILQSFTILIIYFAEK